MDNWARLCYYRYFVVGGEDDDRDDSLKSKRCANFDLVRSKLAHQTMEFLAVIIKMEQYNLWRNIAVFKIKKDINIQDINTAIITLEETLARKKAF